LSSKSRTLVEGATLPNYNARGKKAKVKGKAPLVEISCDQVRAVTQSTMQSFTAAAMMLRPAFTLPISQILG
jgi:hypothetical protein